MTFSLSFCLTHTYTLIHTKTPPEGYQYTIASSGGVPPCSAFWGRWECPDFECTLLTNTLLRKHFMGSCSQRQGVVPALSPRVLHPAAPPHSAEHHCSCLNFWFMFISSCLVLCFKSHFGIRFNWRNENLLKKEIFRKCNYLLLRGSQKSPYFLSMLSKMPDYWQDLYSPLL